MTEPRVSIRVPDRPRRTHAERAAATRGKIVDAVVESIAEVGYRRTTAQEITRRAGVTWGAVNHHFGGKQGILAAVLESSFDHFASLVESIPRRGLSLEQRAGLFVERAWLHFSDPRYASTFQILINHAPTESGDGGPRWQDTMAEAWDAVWQELFDDVGIPIDQLHALQRYTVAVLTGLAATRMMQGANPTEPTAELAMLRDTLVGGLVDRRSP